MNYDSGLDDGLSIPIEFVLNGEKQSLTVPTSMTALQLLRDSLGRLGVRASCERAVCGSCTVLSDSQPLASCAVFAWDLDGHEVETIEGMERQGTLSPEQQAFVDCGAFQCGFCTSGMILLATSLLRHHARPTGEQTSKWMSSNICRCTGYKMITEAVERAATIRLEEGTS